MSSYSAPATHGPNHLPEGDAVAVICHGVTGAGGRRALSALSVPLRYPGGKQRLLRELLVYLRPARAVAGHYVEPFLGGAAVFLALNPQRAILSDYNEELVSLYRAVRRSPTKVWELFSAMPDTREGYYLVRAQSSDGLALAERAARTLYLSRTCFKGMWRHNARGEFNVGYGGQDRRWVISKADLLEVSRRLRNATLRRSDFEAVIDGCTAGDFLFCDPPYCPGAREVTHEHYKCGRFVYAEHERLARALGRASGRGVLWALTTSSHREVMALFPEARKQVLALGTGRTPGLLARDSGEAIVCNYDEEGAVL